jgi:RNA polymerase sigma-70 factor, ECF subfamily
MTALALTGAFLEGVGEARAAWEGEELAPSLGRALEEGRGAWPGLEVPPAAFARALGARVEVGLGPEGLGKLHAGDLYLACGCVLGMPAAVNTFVERFLSQVPQHLSRLRVRPDLVDEVRQELAHKLLVAVPPEPPHLASYGGRGPLGGWVAVCAQRLALTALARREESPAFAGADPLERAVAGAPDPELEVARAHLRQDFEEAVRAALATLSPRDRTLLRLGLVSGLSCRKVALMYGVNAATVARWNAAIRAGLLAEVERFLKDRRGIEPSELPSLLGLARSQLELSLSGLASGPK